MHRVPSTILQGAPWHIACCTVLVRVVMVVAAVVGAAALAHADSEPGESPEDALLEARLRRANELHDQPSLVTFDIEPAGAEIRVDGEVLGAAPLAIHIAAGSHQVALSAPGHRDRRMTIILEYGEPKTLALALTEQVLAEPPPTHVPVSSEVPSETVTAQPRAWHVTLGGRWSLVPEDREGGWVGITAGVRGLADRLELQALGGRFGSTIGRGFGAAARVYVGTGRVQPFFSSAVLVGSARGYELGVGVVSPVGRSANGDLSLDAVLQVELLTIRDAAQMAASPARVVIPITLGLAARM